MGMFKKVLNAVSPVASVINKSGPVASLLGMKKKGSTGTKGGFGNMMASLANDPKAQNALQEGQARIAPKKMSKGGATHKMPDGSMMKGASHKMGHGGRVKKMSHGGSASKRADGCAVKGKTRGRIV
jgi:hypothetical protein